MVTLIMRQRPTFQLPQGNINCEAMRFSSLNLKIYCIFNFKPLSSEKF